MYKVKAYQIRKEEVSGVYKYTIFAEHTITKSEVKIIGETEDVERINRLNIDTEIEMKFDFND